MLSSGPKKNGAGIFRILDIKAAIAEKKNNCKICKTSKSCIYKIILGSEIMKNQTKKVWFKCYSS